MLHNTLITLNSYLPYLLQIKTRKDSILVKFTFIGNFVHSVFFHNYFCQPLRRRMSHNGSLLILIASWTLDCFSRIEQDEANQTKSLLVLFVKNAPLRKDTGIPQPSFSLQISPFIQQLKAEMYSIHWAIRDL